MIYGFVLSRYGKRSEGMVLILHELRSAVRVSWRRAEKEVLSERIGRVVRDVTVEGSDADDAWAALVAAEAMGLSAPPRGYVEAASSAIPGGRVGRLDPKGMFRRHFDEIVVNFSKHRKTLGQAERAWVFGS